ncbi:hypothetical protein BHU72_04145 [Desulfuribacillus stibiiarsenatis]|uniref:Uncharacterized protein n=1 Tax=Desulfuribacillus stibiiarsenatis TaxID=1390249 RepID=A0A1E5L552_9FIRM|nr:hypothetical protein [Desulfuribacillus stibiiarsenatis]OEH85292.1 hypothetical protein BHU72_04145 [Desulfuribacillus stibiiarsenatis]
MSNKPLDIHEIDGQLEFVIEHLEDKSKKNNKKAASYYLYESTIERIKTYAQKYNMKENQFIEEVMNKLMDEIENKGNSAKAQNIQPINNQPRLMADPQTTSWSRIFSGKTTRDQEVNDNSISSENMDENVDDNIDKKTEEKALKLPETSGPETKTPKIIDALQLAELEEKMLEYIFDQYKPDYRILYQRFESKIEKELDIEGEVILQIVRSLHSKKYVTHYTDYNLLDINKKIFEEKLPDVKDVLKFYEDDDIIT